MMKGTPVELQTPTEKVVEDTSSEPFEVFQLFWNADML
jgi:hypothetical protein